MYCYMLCYYRYMPSHYHCNFYYMIHRYIFNSWYLTLVFAMLYLTHDTGHRYLPCYIWHMIPDTGTCHAIFDPRYPTPVLAMLLPCYIWHMIPHNGTCHAIFDTWYQTPVLTMLYLTHDIRHRYLPCYIWPMISDTGTCHAIFNTWYRTPVLAMLYLTHDTRHRYLPCYIWHLIYDTSIWHAILATWYMTPVLDICYHLVLAHLTWYCDPWPDTITPDTCITGHIMIITFIGTWHDYYIITRHLVLLNSCTPVLLYLLYSCPLHCYSC